MLNIFSLTPTGPLPVNWSTPIHQCSVQGEWVLEIKEMKSAIKIFFTVAVSDMLEKYKKTYIEIKIRNFWRAALTCRHNIYFIRSPIWNVWSLGNTLLNTYIYFSINAIHSETFYSAIIKLSLARDQERYREVGSLSTVWSHFKISRSKHQSISTLCWTTVV